MGLKKYSVWVILSLAGLPGFLMGQAIVEHATISGGVATVGSSAKSAARVIDGALKNLNNTLDTAAKKAHPATAPADSSSARRALTPVASPARQPSASLPKIEYEDPAGIKAGMSYDELLRRFGEPAMKVSSGSGEETLYYSRKDGQGQIPVRVSNGRVLSADADGKPESAAVE